MNSDLIKEFLISDSSHYTNNVMEEREKQLQDKIQAKNKDDFRKNAGWGDWCGPSDLKLFKESNTDEILQKKAQMQLNQQLERADIDG